MKFGRRLAAALPPALAPYALPYTALKNHVKSVAGLAPSPEVTFVGSPDSSLESSAGDEGAAPLLDPHPGPQYTPAAAATFYAALRDGLVAPAEAAERAAATLSSTLAELPLPGEAEFEPRLQALFVEVDALHSFVVLNYIGLFKLAKKWNKVAGGAPGARVTVLPLLLSSPLLSSRSLQLLFQRTSKLRFEGSAHGGIGGAQPPAAAPAAPPAPPASSPIRVGRRASSGKTALLTTLFPSSGGASFSPSKSGTTTLALSRSSDALAPPPHAPLSQLTEAASSSLTASSSSAAAAAAPPPPLSFSSSAAAGCPVRCEGCVRLQTRFVVLGCAHTFCWGCVAAAAWGQRRSVERQASRGGLDAWDGGWGGAGSAHVAAAAAAAANAAGGGSGSGSGSGGRGGVAAAAAAAVADSEAAEVAEAAAAAADPPPPTGDGAPDAPPPSSKAGGPGWGGLSARFAALPPLATPEAGGDGSQPPQPAPQHPPPASPRAAAAAPAGGGHAATLTCPVCDAVADLEKGHLEVNSLVSDDAFLWLLSRDGERSGGRRHSSRSLLAGIDFASMSVQGSPRSDAGPLHAAPSRLGRVHSWGSISLPQPAAR